jgi:hypothetical protein
MHIDDDMLAVVDGEASQLDARIDQAPLSAPVVPYAIMAMLVPAFHLARPLHLAVHRGQAKCSWCHGVFATTGGDR